MDINIKEVPTPQSSSFTMFADPNYDLLNETKTLRVSFSFISKTRISTSMQIGNSRHGINFEAGGIKTHEVAEWNMFSGVREVKHYFVKSKKQDLEVYKEYVKAIVIKAMECLRVNLDELTIELEADKFNR